MSANGTADFESESELSDGPYERPAGFVVPGSVPEYDGGWELDLTPTACPDQPMREGDELDARLWAGQFSRARGTGQMRLRESARLVLPTRAAVNRYLDEVAGVPGRERGERLREAWGLSGDGFAFGADQVPSLVGGSALTQQFVPLIPGPVTRQLYWQDYFQMSAKAFEAYNHDPLSWRAVHLREQFALGAGLKAKVTKSTGAGKGQTHDAAQEVWDRFWKTNDMDDRLKKIARDIEIYGEQFIRYFQEPGNLRGLLVRSLDPATIYDIVTDPEDFETVFFYHQQFQAPYQLYAPPGTRPRGGQPAPTGETLPGAATRYIIRQIDWAEIDHYRINVGNSERRGRSSLFPVLGWIKRLRDYMTSKVIQADMQSRYAWDLEVKGNRADVVAVQQAMFPGGKPPAPGSILGHSQSVTLTPTNFQAAAQGLAGDATFEALVNLIAVGVGVPKEYLGVTGRATRANALVATEPGAKGFEDLQELLRKILENVAERVFKQARINDAEIEFTFPSIASEERTKKLEDLARAEGMGWVSKQTSATVAAKELDIENYDFEQEQQLIAAENPPIEEEDVPGAPVDPVTGKKPQRPKQGDGTVRRQVILAQFRQTGKLDITKSPSAEDDPPGLLVPTDGSPVEAGGGATRGGLPADQNPASAAGAESIKTALKAREADAPSFNAEQVAWLLREARAPRRRPDDPAFLQHGREYREKSAEHLGQLVKDATRA